MATQSKTRFWVFAAGVALVIFAAAYIGTQIRIQTFLVADTKSEGLSWVHHIEARLPDIVVTAGGNYNGGMPTLRPDAAALTEFAADIFRSSNIYEIDLINVYCLCGVRLRNSAIKSEALGTHNHGPGQPTLRHDVSVSPPSQELLNYVLNTHDLEPPQSVAVPAAAQIGFDTATALGLALGGEDRAVIREGTDANSPRTYGEVYHQITMPDGAIYRVKVLVDLDARAATVQALVYGGALFVFVLAGVFFAFPAQRYLAASKREQAATARALYLANHDVLTGVANRNALKLQGPKTLEDYNNEGKKGLLIMVNVADLKGINDFHGNMAGDRALRQAALTLAHLGGADSVVARIGADEFVLLMPETPALKGILAALDAGTGFVLESGQTVTVPFRGGVAHYPAHGAAFEELMQSAELALLHARKGNGCSVCEYSAGMRRAFQTRIDLFRDFRVALEKDQVQPFYQPLIDMKTGQVNGFESLARWVDPERGVLTPGVFHEVLDDPELCAKVGRAVTRHALNDMGKWTKNRVAFGCIGVNVGDGDLLRADLCTELAQLLGEHGIAPRSLAIEVTENCMFGANKALFMARVAELEALGCYIALDDFGTGYSSITQIKELPLKGLKIDKSFVNGIIENPVDQAIVRNLIALGASIGFEVIAEGVETKAQHNLLRDLGCDLAQGFYYSPAVSADEVPMLVERINGGQLCDMRASA